MTKTELIKRVQDARELEYERLRHCTAWVEYCEDRQVGRTLIRLRSYNTIVAVYIEDTLYVFDYWSATTAQHISKFEKAMRPEYVVYLYQRSDRMTVWHRHVETIIWKKKQFIEAYRTDFAKLVTDSIGDYFE